MLPDRGVAAPDPSCRFLVGAARMNTVAETLAAPRPSGTQPRLAAVHAGGATDATAASWDAFTGAATDEAFHAAWLALQCGAVAGTIAGLLLLRASDEGAFAPAATWPSAHREFTHLSDVAQRALGERRGVVAGGDEEAEGAARGTVQVAFPLELDGDVAGAVVLELRARPAGELQHVLRQLLWGAGWLQAQLRRRELARQGGVLERASIGIELLQAVQEPETLAESAMALVNELATTAKADRVSLGIERKGTMRLAALSRTAWFDPKSQLADALERAMEEAVDQEAWTAHPHVEGSHGVVTLAQRALATRTGAAAVLTVPILDAGSAIGALTLECDQGPAFDRATITLCEAVAALVGPTLRMRVEAERWFAGRAARTWVDWRDRLIGPGHATVKTGAVLVAALVLFLAFAEGEFRVSARTAIEGSVQRAAVAPFDGFIRDARVRAGANVRKGELLAVMDDRDLKLDRARWQSEHEQVERKYGEALAKRERASTVIIAAQLAQAEAQLELADAKLARTRLEAPFDGVVVSGDLSQSLGAPVEKGKVLFELAPLDHYRVVLKVDERDIGYVRVGQHGELALPGLSGETLPFSVSAVTSVSTPQEGRNFFRVEAQLGQPSARLRPGMEGVGKIAIGEHRLAWIWTRHFVDWARLSLWNWMP
jgi:hypothetical protein